MILWEGSSDAPPDVTADRAYRFAVVVANERELYVPWGVSFNIYLGVSSGLMLNVTFSGNTIHCSTTPKEYGGGVTITMIGSTD